MLDHPKKTRELISILEAAVPFEAALMPDVIEPSRDNRNQSSSSPSRLSRKSHTSMMWAGSFATSNPRTQRARSSSRSPTCECTARSPSRQRCLEYRSIE